MRYWGSSPWHNQVPYYVCLVVNYLVGKVERRELEEFNTHRDITESKLLLDRNKKRREKKGL